MKVFKLSIKNLFVNWWRTLTLGTFIFFGSLILVLVGNFSATVKSNMEDAIRNSVTGDIQIRPANSPEKDMLDIASNWSKLKLINKNDMEKIRKVAKENLNYKEAVGLVRQNVLIQTEKGRSLSMIAGIDKDISPYKEAIDLREGRFLHVGSKNEIVLSGILAEKLGIRLGQEIDVISQPEPGKMPSQTPTLKMKVVGIGDLKLLSGFSVSVLYTNIEDARYLMGINKGEFTDFVIYTGNSSGAEGDAQKLKSALAVTSTKDNFKVTTWDIMGKFIMDGISVNVILFYSFAVIFLFIISILTINLIYMIGLERRQQVGTLRAIGFSFWKIVSIFLVEILLAALFFCVLGISVATGIVMVIGRTGLEIGPPMDFLMGKHFYMKYYPEQSLTIFAIMMGFSLLAAFYPSAKAAGVRPVDTLREM